MQKLWKTFHLACMHCKQRCFRFKLQNIQRRQFLPSSYWGGRNLDKGLIDCPHVGWRRLLQDPSIVRYRAFLSQLILVEANQHEFSVAAKKEHFSIMSRKEGNLYTHMYKHNKGFSRDHTRDKTETVRRLQSWLTIHSNEFEAIIGI